MSTYSRLIVIGLTLFCLVLTTTHAQPVVLNDSDKTYHFFPSTLAFEDKAGNLTIDSLLRHPQRYAFVPIKQAGLPSASRQPYWFKIDLTNPTPDNYFLHFFFYGDQKIGVYEVDKNRVLQNWLVDFYGASTTDLFQRSRGILPMRLGQGQTHTLYFRADEMDMTTLHVGAMSSLRLAKETHYQDLLYGLFFGIVLLLSAYTLMLGVQLKDRDNLLYAIWLIPGGFMLLLTRGTALEIPGDWLIPLKHNYGVVIGIVVGLRLAFALSFLQIKQQAKWLYKLGIIQIGVITVGVVGLLCAYALLPDDREWQKNVAVLIAFSGIVFDGLAGTVIWFRKRYKPALFYIFGAIISFISNFLFQRSFFGAMPLTFWLLNSIYIGRIGEVLFFLLGLTYKINQLKKNQEEAIRQQLKLSEENRHLIENQNRVLEEKVEQRTAQLQESLTTLQVTQAQLIQKEKLASLGELTAGIAHEIQNPLNFVNNFSEVSTELVKEIQDERQKTPDQRDQQLETELLDDLGQNLEKITHHGKRAGAIVRGMLEHSRTSTGEKVLTDLNALADEYLRLAYYGLQAKDKNFNCTLDTRFDAHLPNVSVVAQDIGRVLLNLFNNGFYALQQKAKQDIEGYQPTLTVCTEPTETGVRIIVRDNGIGIPDAICQKIFQPFFTTKPTGEGTGLGLSLSYDIITKGHGGTMTVESREGEGAQFVITLPC